MSDWERALTEYGQLREEIGRLEETEECGCNVNEFYTCNLCSQTTSLDQRARALMNLWGDIWAMKLAMNKSVNRKILEALKGLMYLTDQHREGGLILSRYDRKPLTNGDQDIIDRRAYLAAEAAISQAESAQCDHPSMDGDEGPVDQLGRSPKRWKCNVCGAIVHDPEPAESEPAGQGEPEINDNNGWVYDPGLALTNLRRAETAWTAAHKLAESLWELLFACDNQEKITALGGLLKRRMAESREAFRQYAIDCPRPAPPASVASKEEAK